MKRIFSSLVAAIMLLGLFCFPAQAAEKKLIAVTFDDGPGKFTDQLLDGLKARGAKATFFVVGDCVRYRPEIVNRAYQEGHQIGEHSYNHPDLNTLSIDEVKKQFQDSTDLLDKICGIGTDYMIRPPYGKANPAVLKALDVPFILWSVDPMDWADHDALQVKNFLVNHAADGSIILLHDLLDTTVDGALSAIDILKKKGFEFVTVSELFRRRGVPLENAKQYYQCMSNGTDLGAVSTPVISSVPEGDLFRITISAQPDVPIYYSIDGSPIKQGCPQYTEPFLVSAPATVQAVAAYDLNGGRSETVSQTFDLPKAQCPGFSLDKNELTFSCPTPDASVYYSVTTDGQATEELLYRGDGISLAPGSVITAYTKAAKYSDSDPVTVCYTPLKNMFCDVLPGAWYFDAVDSLCATKVMACPEPGHFHPDTPVTRGELMTALYHASGDATPTGQAPFQDVQQEDPLSGAILWASQEGIVKGYEDGTFRAQDSVSRQEMAVFLQRYLRHQGVELLGSDLTGYSDTSAIAIWARDAVGELTACQLLVGEGGRFNPNASANRGQTAVLLHRVLEYRQDG